MLCEEYDAHSRRRRQVSPYSRLKGERGTLSREEVEYECKGWGEIMLVLLESSARQNYNLGDVIPPRRNGLHIPRAAGTRMDSWMKGASR